jgi:hypothetical protein
MMTALRTLNMLGMVTNESGMENDEVTLGRLKNKFQLKASMETMSRRNALEAEQKEVEVVTSLQQRLPEAERKIKAADGKVDGRNIYKADLQAVLIIKYHKNVRQVSKSTHRLESYCSLCLGAHILCFSSIRRTLGSLIARERVNLLCCEA